MGYVCGPMTATSQGLSSVEDILAAVSRGEPVVIVDDENRENEGDIIIAAEKVTQENIAFTIRYTGGVICLAMSDDHADHLELPPMVSHNTAKRGTAYTVSIEAREGVTTGISAQDRATTIRAAVKPGVTAADLARPGHVFPLRARAGGVLRRAGHTEAAVDLARLAGLFPAGIVSELMHDDGTMMRLPAILEFCGERDIPVGSIADLIAYRLQSDGFVKHVASAALPTDMANFHLHGFKDELNNNEHVAITLGDISGGKPVLVRMHSECLTGDALHSLRCDCGAQRDAALAKIAEEGAGVLVYLRQEGRGIGLLNKIEAYALQDQGADTVEANERLGLPADLRDYGIGAQMLHHLGVKKMRLMTNNPRKIAALRGYGLEVVDRVPIEVGKNKYNEKYLRTKADKMGHMLTEE